MKAYLGTGIFSVAVIVIIMATQEKKSGLGCWGDKKQLIEIPGVYTKRRKCLVVIIQGNLDLSCIFLR